MAKFNLDKPLATQDGGEGLKLLRNIFIAALQAGASDIHLQPDEEKLRVRFRIDGLLSDSDAVPLRHESAVIAALINQTDTMKIDEYRHPMDGRLLLEQGGRRFDLRINIAPTKAEGGEVATGRRSAAIRILSKDSIVGGLSGLGFTADAIANIRQITKHPHGMLLVTGPTGSGKSTTLASILGELNKPDRKLITIEDPVEYAIRGVEQIEVSIRAELTFATALRAILRRDPDIIMVGEIRDPETAKTAINASLTGHLVLSTLHTNDAPSATERLIDLGVEHYLLADILVGVLAQRLVRRICPQCKTDRQISSTEMERLSSYAAGGTSVRMWKGTGCKACNDTGYKGRVAIHELLVVTPELIRLIARRAPLLEIREAAAQAGMKTMYDDGIQKALAGLTTIEEVLAHARHDS